MSISKGPVLQRLGRTGSTISFRDRRRVRDDWQMCTGMVELEEKSIFKSERRAPVMELISVAGQMPTTGSWHCMRTAGISPFPWWGANVPNMFFLEAACGWLSLIALGHVCLFSSFPSHSGSSLTCSVLGSLKSWVSAWSLFQIVKWLFESFVSCQLIIIFFL